MIMYVMRWGVMLTVKNQLWSLLCFVDQKEGQEVMMVLLPVCHLGGEICLSFISSNWTSHLTVFNVHMTYWGFSIMVYYKGFLHRNSLLTLIKMCLLSPLEINVPLIVLKFLMLCLKVNLTHWFAWADQLETVYFYWEIFLWRVKF